MNEKYLITLQEDLRLKNFAENTQKDYYRFVIRFLDFTGKAALSVTYADIHLLNQDFCAREAVE